MPLFKLPFEENFPIKIPFDGHVQPFGDGPAGVADAGGGTTVTGFEITVVLTEPDGLVVVDVVVDRVATADGVEFERPSKRIVWPGRMVKGSGIWLRAASAL